MNSLFSKGQRATTGLTPGTHDGRIIAIEQRDGEWGPFVVFRGETYDDAGNLYDVSATASYDTNKNRKMMRWLLAINGLTPEEFDEAADLSELRETGDVLFVISYEKRNRDGTTTPTEFPNVVDILPVPGDNRRRVRR